MKYVPMRTGVSVVLVQLTVRCPLSSLWNEKDSTRRDDITYPACVYAYTGRGGFHLSGTITRSRPETIGLGLETDRF